MPKIEQTIANVNVKSHTFNFITPTMTEQFKIPNPCTSLSHGQDAGMGEGNYAHVVQLSPWRGDR
jgi:hypothetical protein